MRDTALYLKEIVAAMNAIEGFVSDVDFREFQDNDMLSSAVIRKFEIMGEAAKMVPDDMRSRHPGVPWKEMAGMRDRLIHFYFGIKFELVWATIQDVIPRVKPLVQKIITEIAE